ncbi:glycosyltransferase 87 family protein [Actinokineospora inagensis]|uniref:glycosyltransferase 87 family protein n=1 Tax=Actinokineospora inagensis TaxID=103730 RepID=UPI0004271401|nr:glycosyltransferase 87 family protein [Actinokineospora inagensis]
MRVLVTSAVLLSGLWIIFTATRYHLDLEVYRIGVNAWLSGGDIYGTLPETATGVSLPFIYPPFAAAAMVPLTVISQQAANIILSIATVVLTGVTLHVLISALKLSRNWMALLPLVLFLEPVRATLDYGQINVIIMALVTVDCLIPEPHWPRGVLVGIAAAVKLTPAAFVLYFLLRRDWKTLANAGISFVAATAVGFALAWDESVRFWTSEVFSTSEKVGTGFFTNQSVLGVLTRADAAALWPVLSLVVIAVTVVSMRRVPPATAFALNSLAILLVSPISWSHHWVWCLPALVIFAVEGRRVLAAVGAVLFMVAPHMLGIPAVTDAYFAYALIALVLPLAVRTKSTADKITVQPGPRRAATVRG